MTARRRRSGRPLIPIARVKKFEMIAGRPAFWQHSAMELIAAANLVRRRYEEIERLGARRKRRVVYVGELHPWTFLMLYGFALECLLKGLRIANGLPATDGAGNLNPQLLGHNLLEQAGHAHFPLLSDRERQFVVEVSNLLEIGRYPVRTSASKSAAASYVTPDDPRMIIALLERADAALGNEEPRSAWKLLHLDELGLRLRAFGPGRRRRAPKEKP